MTALSLALVIPWATGVVLVLLDGRSRLVGWLAVTALLLVLVLRVVLAFESRDIDDVAEEEAEHDAVLERRHAREHEDEEAAAR